MGGLAGRRLEVFDWIIIKNGRLLQRSFMKLREVGEEPLEVGKFLKVNSEHTVDGHGEAVGLKKQVAGMKLVLLLVCFHPSCGFLIMKS